MRRAARSRHARIRMSRAARAPPPASACAAARGGRASRYAVSISRRRPLAARRKVCVTREARQRRTILTRGEMRAGLDDLEAFDVADLLAARGVILVDVPGVPVARLVLGIGPELVAATRQRLAPGRLVDEARDRPVVAEFDPQMRVLEMARADARAPPPARSFARSSTATPSGGMTSSLATSPIRRERRRNWRARQRGIDDERARRRASPLGALRDDRAPSPARLHGAARRDDASSSASASS